MILCVLQIEDEDEDEQVTRCFMYLRSLRMPRPSRKSRGKGTAQSEIMFKKLIDTRSMWSAEQLLKIGSVDP